MVGDRLINVLDRKPFIRRVENRIDDRASKIRNRPSRAMQEKVPKIPNRNIGGGVAAGTIQSAIAIILEETVGVPFGGSTEVTEVDSVQGGNVYTVNVDAPTENMSKAKAFFQANTGFTSLLTDLIQVDNVEVLRTRPLRDTYQVKILVED